MVDYVDEKGTHGAREIVIAHTNTTATTPNRVSTTKYTPLNFVPRMLMAYFSSRVNLAYVAIALLQQVPGASPSFKHDTAILLLLVFAWEVAMAVVAEIGRRAADSAVNGMLVVRLNAGSRAYEQCKRQDIGQGDVVKLAPGDVAPADMVLLHVQPVDAPDSGSGPSDCGPQSCLVSTAQLDGESAPKRKVAVLHLGLTDASAVSDSVRSMCLRCGPPNGSIDQFVGVLVNTGHAGEAISIGPERFVPAGSVLATGTDHVLGAVVYVGHETAAMRKSEDAPSKVAYMDGALDKILIKLAVCLAILALCLATASSVLKSARERALGAQEYGAPVIAVYALTLLMCIPNTYVIARDMVRGFLARAIAHDKLMNGKYGIHGKARRSIVSQNSTASAKETDSDRQHRAVARAYGLVDLLGEVRHVLTDKTGTLTRNEMMLRVVIGADGRSIVLGNEHGDEGDHYMGDAKDFPLAPCFDILSPYLRGSSSSISSSLETQSICETSDKPPEAPIAAFDAMLTAMVICHTVYPGLLPSQADTRRKQYLGESPDETAIVTGAARLGRRLDARSSNAIVVTLANGSSQSFDILAVLPFESRRMRMSVVVRDKCDGAIHVYTKGAELSVRSCSIEPIANPQIANHHDNTQHHLSDVIRSHSQDGLRMLVYAWRTVPNDEWDAWLPTWIAAQTSGHGLARQHHMEEVMSAMERNLVIIGATGVEDALQEGVPECLDALRSAGINIWMVTGDTVGTAVSVARHCGLAGPNTDVLPFTTAANAPALASSLARTSLPENRMLTIKGEDACKVLAKEPGALISAAQRSNAVILYRCSPAQKAEIARMLVKETGSTCLAIGDGANDVEMLRSASVGVGLSGREGNFAHAAGDFALARFAHLTRLLLVHGAQARARVFRAMCLFFYKSVALGMTAVAYQVPTLFSGIVVGDTAMYGLHNMVFTIGAFLAVAVLDTPLGAESSLVKDPQRYHRPLGGLRAVFISTAYGALDAFAIVGTVSAVAMLGQEPLSLTVFYHVCYAALLLAVIVRSVVLVRVWTRRMVLVAGIGYIMWLGEVILLDVIVRALRTRGPFILLKVPGILHYAWQPRIWLLVTLATSATILVEVLLAFASGGYSAISRRSVDLV